MTRLASIVFSFTSALLGLVYTNIHADVLTAKQAMENSLNPLLQVTTTQGTIFIELFPNEAPNNVENFVALADGEVEIFDPITETAFRPRHFDGIRFHHVVPGFLIQAGPPLHNPLGAPQQVLKDEINADALGLGNQTVLNTNGAFNELLNIDNRIDFEELILKPLYQKMNIVSELELQKKQYEVLEILENLSVKEVYENLGFRFTTDHPTRAISRGIVALANQGPASNETAFFITLGDSPWLTGKHTVIGKVVEGMEVVDAIGEQPIDPLRSSQLSTVIYSIRRVDQAN